MQLQLNNKNEFNIVYDFGKTHSIESLVNSFGR